MLPKFSLRDVIQIAVVFILFGIYVPYRRGFDFFDTLLLVPYSCISFLFCAPAVIDSIYANGRNKVTLPPIVSGIVYGWLSGMALVILGIVTVNLTQHMPQAVLPPAAVLLSAMVISLLGCGFVAGLGVWSSFVEDNPRDAKKRIRIGFLAFLCALWFIPMWLPQGWQDWLALQMTSDKLARNTLISAPLGLFVDVLILGRVVGRMHPGERNSLKIS